MLNPYESRREHHGVQLYGLFGIPYDDAEQRFQQHKRNYEFFNAPGSSPSTASSGPG